MISQNFGEKSFKQVPVDIVKRLLEYVYIKYHKRENTHRDPIQWLYKYGITEDVELVGIISALLAFGNAKAFNGKIGYILGLWESPSAEIIHTSDRELKQYLRGFKHRFVDGELVATLLLGVKRFILEYGSIGKGIKFLREKMNKKDIRILLLSFTKEIRKKSRNKLHFILPDPEKKGSCKRLLLYLRWMVRRDEIDLGCWDFIMPTELVVPLDTHIHQWALALGLTSSKVANYNTALEITDRLREFSPSDPLKYDFSLCIAGMLGERDKILKKFGVSI